jgi:hypothetical protein
LLAKLVISRQERGEAVKGRRVQRDWAPRLFGTVGSNRAERALDRRGAAAPSLRPQAPIRNGA